MTTSLLERAISRGIRLFDGFKSVVTLRQQLAGQVTCLLYHRVAEDGDHAWIEHGGVPVTHPSAFRRQMEFLCETGCRFFTMKELADGAFPENAEHGIVVTFDDGFADNFHNAQPILDEFKIPAVFLVTSGLIEATELNWDHQICWYSKQSTAKARARMVVSDLIGHDFDRHDISWTWRHLLTQDQARNVLQELRQHFGPIPGSELKGLYASVLDLRSAATRGHEIGAHSVSHPMRHTLLESEFLLEMTESKQFLEDALQSPVTSFSFPFNSFLFSDADLCRRTGYTAVATSEAGRVARKTDIFGIPRRTVFRTHNRLNNFRALLAEERWKQ